MTPEAPPIPLSEKLKLDWQTTHVAPEQSNFADGEADISDEQENSFDATGWLGEFYDYYYETDKDRLDGELVGIASQVLNEVSNPDNQETVANLLDTLSPQTDDEPQGIFKRFRSGIRDSLSRVKHYREFEELILGLEQEKAKPKNYTSYEAAALYADQLSIERLYELAQQSETLPPEEKEIVEEVGGLAATIDNLTDVLLAQELARGNEGLLVLQTSLTQADQDIRVAFESGAPLKVSEVLFRNQAFLQELNGGDSLDFLSTLPSLGRASTREWRRTRPQLEHQVQQLFTEENKRKISVDNLIHQNVIQEDTIAKLEGMAGMSTCQARLAALEEIFKRHSIPPERQKIIIAESMYDLFESGISPRLVEDIVNGGVSSEDLVSYQVLEWLNTQINLEELEANPLISDRVKKILKTIPKVAGAAGGGYVLYELLTHLPDISPDGSGIPVPGLSLPDWKVIAASVTAGIIAKRFIGGPSLPIGGALRSIPGIEFLAKMMGKQSGGGADLELGNPFEGLASESHHVQWHVEKFPPSNHPPYFREKSSEVYDPHRGWVDELKTLTQTGVEFNPTEEGWATNLDFGEIHGKRPKRKSGFWYIPVPYGAVPVRMSGKDRSEDGFDRRSDGSLGIDVDIQTNPNDDFKKRIAKSRQRHIDFSETNADYIVIYPITEKALDPILPSMDCLPSPIRGLLEDLDSRGLSKQQEAVTIINYIRDNFIYSMDPANGPLYKKALDKSHEEFFRTLFTVKKVKCDGAATCAISLLRMRGIPSRLAVGYVYEGDEVLKASQAHGWVEYMVDDGLEVGDPTPVIEDEVTKKIHQKSEFIAKLIERFSIYRDSRWSEMRCWDERNTNATLMDRVFHRLTPFIPRGEVRIRYPNFSDKKLRRQTREKLMDARQVIDEIEEEQVQTPLDSNDVISRLAEGNVATERYIRYSMLTENFERMTQIALVDFYDRTFSGNFPITPELANEWGYPYLIRENSPPENKWGSSSDKFQSYIKNYLRAKGLDPISNPDVYRQGIEDFGVDVDNDDLTTVVHKLTGRAIYGPMEQRTPDRKHRRQWNETLSSLIQQSATMIPRNAVEDSYILPLVQSYINAAQILKESDSVPQPDATIEVDDDSD